MKRIYIYPKNDYQTLEVPNPYVLNVEKSLATKHTFSNNSPNLRGILELFVYLGKTDVYFFNWIEDVAIKRFGLLQVISLPFFLLISRIINKKIIWVMHNLYSHQRRRKSWIKFSFKLLVKRADLIITHSNEGEEFLRKNFNRYASKAQYIIHPMDEFIGKKEASTKTYDILLWGTIFPYKAIVEFLKFSKQSDILKDKKILVSGVCLDKELKGRLLNEIGGNITYRDGFFDMDEIATMINDSKYTLFTYQSESVLSSGSLMDSIRMGAMIIGPDKGAFRDLKEYPFLLTYKDWNEIETLIEDYQDNVNDRLRESEKFCQENSWDSYTDKLFLATKGIL